MPTTDHPEHAIRCPWCEAPARTRCTTKRGRDLPFPSHQARIDAWTTQQAKNAQTDDPSPAEPQPTEPQ